MTDQLRQWFPNYERDLDRVRRFWAGEGRCLVSLNATQYAYRQKFDETVIFESALRNLQVQADLPGINLPSFYPDWGTISTAKYWGGTARFDSTGGNIFIDPVAQTLDEALALKPLPFDDPAQDGAHGIRLYHRLCQVLHTDALWLRSPDMQGALNTAGLIMNQENLMMAFHDDQAKARAFVERVADFLIDYALYLRRESGNRVCGNIWPFTFFPSDTGISFTEDLMPLVSPKIYREFGIPMLKKFSQALGKLHIHCCGSWGRHARTLAESDLDIAAIEFHHPETRIEELDPLAGRVVLIPYVLLHKETDYQSNLDYYRYLLDHYGHRHRFWFALADDTPESQAFAREFEY